MSLTLEASQDPAGIKRRSNLAEIYLVRDPKTHSGSGTACLR
jgi:Na+-transporting NADH:ubiquinone oxidoreductase subunit C